MKTVKKKIKYAERECWLYVDLNEEECTVEWYVSRKPRSSMDYLPILWGEFDVELYVDGTWLPYEETATKKSLELLEKFPELFKKLGMRDSDE